MSEKTAYLWGPISNFSAYLAAWLLDNGWRVDLPSKSAWHVSLSPLDLQSSAQSAIEKALGSQEKFKAVSDKLRLLDATELPRDTTYDTVLFCALPSNFDEPRVSRAIWASNELQALSKRLKGIPTIIFSSLWGAIQADGVVPEEIEFVRRKSRSQFEAVCQQYELKILSSLTKQEFPWHWVRLPLLSGSTTDGSCTIFSGLSNLIERMLTASEQKELEETGKLPLNYNPDASLWMLPVDVAAELAGRIIEDTTRPRICNLVSTQTTLNQEWLQTLAKLIGFSGIEASEKDNLALPGTLRGMLADNIQVKTRSLFELMGRHHLIPQALDREYFEKLIAYGNEENWGRLRPLQAPQEPFSEQIAEKYFERFMPANLDEKSLAYLKEMGEEIIFSIDEKQSWQVLLDNERVLVSSISSHDNRPAAARCLIASTAFNQLIQGKLSLEQALLTREVRLHGKPLQIFKTFAFIKHFLRERPYMSSKSANAFAKKELQSNRNH